jgi:hypothetical protein
VNSTGLRRIDESPSQVDIVIRKGEHRLWASCGAELDDHEAHKMLAFRTANAGVHDLRDLLKAEDAIARWCFLVSWHVRDERGVLDALVLPGPIQGTAKGGEIAADRVTPCPGFRSPVAKAEL